MQEAGQKLDQLSELLNQLYGLPAIALVGILCLMAGWLLKTQSWFPNDGIPLVVILLGGAFLPLMSDWLSSKLPFRIWLVRNLVVGCIVGAGAWLMHKTVIKRIRDYFSK